MKKIISLLLLFVLVGTFAVGCTKDEEILVVSREDGSGTRGAFIELTGILEKDSNGNKVDRTTKEAVVQMQTDSVLTAVAGNEYTIGYVSTGSLNDSVKALKVEDSEPTTENIKSGDYKIARPFNIATKGEVSRVSKDFINYIMSKEGQEIVSNSYISIDDSLDWYSGNDVSGKIVVAGSSSVTPVMEKLSEAYMNVNQEVQIEVQMSGSSAGMQAAMDGTADIGMASRELKDSEKEVLDYIAIAVDGIAVVVNPKNTVEDISIEEIKKIFIGEMTEWSKLQ